tara:strand:+ start:943 stop:1200 length:258 start_codon:yes stop_codon:yes gene_type:complete
MIKKILKYLKIKIAKRKERKSKRAKLGAKLIRNDNLCRKLCLQMARENQKALSKTDYEIDRKKFERIIFLSLQQLEIQQLLKYGT